MNPQAIEVWIEETLAQMTLEEKVSLLSGRDWWYTAPIERLGVPPVAMTDGPHGVRTDTWTEERPRGAATSFPTGVSMAASWDPALIERVGAALAAETRALDCDILLAPCVNIARTPVAGRNFESYSEDPYLAGRIGVAYVKGLQEQGVGASLKHYACNNQEVERMRGNSVVDERTLREIYLPAFEAVVKEARPWTVMCAYNRINGVYASEHQHLLRDILKGEWGFEGPVISDWGANHTIVESVAGGLDIEMPGPAKYYGQLLVEAVRHWQIEESVIDDAARRVLRLVAWSGRLDEDALPEGALNTPEHQALARELAEASITLLKNADATLPLDATKLRKVAVIGPNGAEARIGGGGSSYLEPPYRVSPLEGLRARLGPEVAVEYARGCDNYAEYPLFQPNLPPQEGAENGLRAQFYNDLALSGEPVAERLEAYLDHWRVSLPPGVDSESFAVRWTGQFRAEESGRHAFKVYNTGTCRLYVDGALLLDATPATNQDWETIGSVAYCDLVAGQTYALQVEYVKPRGIQYGTLFLLGAYAPLPENDDRIARAVALAKESDVAILCMGMAKGFESEGQDRPDLALPGPQAELIRAVAAANPRTVVVVNAGSPVELPWLADVPAVVLAYYPGQEGGHALARLLLGDVNPSGKLPVTFPRRYADNPTYTNYPGLREVRYGEGIFVGYRYYDHKEVEPEFPFGFGLSYTTFEYRDLSVPETVKAGEPVPVRVTLVNTGERAGSEVAQLYVNDPESGLARPPQELKRFAKVTLEPGEQVTLTFELDERALAYYDPVRAGWVVEPGEFEVRVGSSSRDIRARARFTVR